MLMYIHHICVHIIMYSHKQSYTMRNGVLGVIGEVVRQVLNSPELDEQAKCTRDQLLDKLEVRRYMCIMGYCIVELSQYSVYCVGQYIAVYYLYCVNWNWISGM